MSAIGSGLSDQQIEAAIKRGAKGLQKPACRCSRCNAPSAPHYAYCPKCGLETDYIAKRLKSERTQPQHTEPAAVPIN